MYLPKPIKRWAGSLIGPAVAVALTFYFAYNIVIGERGLMAWRRLAAEIGAADTRLTALRAERKALARKVYDMGTEHLDPDLLDERVRASLNLVAPNEIVIMRPSPAAVR